MSQFWLVDSDHSYKCFLEFFEQLYKDKKHVRITWKTGQQRTALQNRSLHKYCEMLGVSLNDAGLDQRVFLKPGIEIPWSQDSVKNQIWRPVQKVVVDKVSTVDLERHEVDKVYGIISRKVSMDYGIYVPWPHDPNKRKK